MDFVDIIRRVAIEASFPLYKYNALFLFGNCLELDKSNLIPIFFFINSFHQNRTPNPHCKYQTLLTNLSTLRNFDIHRALDLIKYIHPSLWACCFRCYSLFQLSFGSITVIINHLPLYQHIYECQ